MQIELHGKTALVAGSTAGIGLSIAKSLAEVGADVIITGILQADVDRAMAEITSSVPGVRVQGYVADLSSAEGCSTLGRLVPSVDILVNSVGKYQARAFGDIGDEEWTDMFNLNVMSGIRLSRLYLEKMIEKAWGRIVFVSSESALNVPVDMIHYGMSKTAQLSVSRGLAKHCAGTGVTVNAVLPGPTMTEGVAAYLKSEAEVSGRPFDEVAAGFVKAARPSSLIQRFQTPEETANLVTYLCSPQASATTGAAVRCEGGIVDSIG